jgi:hypothetical protein
LTSYHVLNRVHMKNMERTPYKEWIGRKPSLSYLRNGVVWQRLTLCKELISDLVKSDVLEWVWHRPGWRMGYTETCV